MRKLIYTDNSCSSDSGGSFAVLGNAEECSAADRRFLVLDVLLKSTYVSRNGCVLSLYVCIFTVIHTCTAAHPSSCQRYRAGSKRACTKLSFPLSLSYGSCLSLQTIPTFQAASLYRISQWSLKAGKKLPTAS